MADKFVIIDLRTMDYFKHSSTEEIIVFNTIEDAAEACGMYEFENAWVCQLVYNHLEGTTD
jgi:hypothetical protein